MKTKIINADGSDKLLGFPAEVPDVNWSPRPCALICGSSRTIWDDLDAAEEIAPEHEKIGINFFPVHYKPQVQHWVTQHQEKALYWKALRAFEQNTGAIFMHSHKLAEGVDFVWGFPALSGTTAVLALKIAYLMNYKKIIFCGVTMDEQPCFYDAPTHRYRYNEVEVNEWRKIAPLCGDRVRAMSGNMKKIFGLPTKEWLK